MDFDLIRKMIPQKIAEDLCSVQPMKTAEIFINRYSPDVTVLLIMGYVLAEVPFESRCTMFNHSHNEYVVMWLKKDDLKRYKARDITASSWKHVERIG